MKLKIPKSKLDCVNIPKRMADHAFGHHHSHRHRMVFGVVFMAIGVLIAKLLHFNLLTHILADIVGYGVHGMGAVPFIDFAIAQSNNQQNQNQS